MDVASILLAAQSPDAAVRNPAEEQIKQAKEQNMVREQCGEVDRLQSPRPRTPLGGPRPRPLASVMVCVEPRL